MEQIERIINLPKDKLCIISNSNANNRKIIHQYFETVYPKIQKISICCKYFDYDWTTKRKCYDCGKFVKMKYHLGLMENNQDEYYGGYCQNCDIPIEYEPNFDYGDDIVIYDNNNIIVIGEFIENHCTDLKELADKDIQKLFFEIINDCKIFIINSPESGSLYVAEHVGKRGKSRLRKRTNKLGEYIEKNMRDKKYEQIL